MKKSINGILAVLVAVYITGCIGPFEDESSKDILTLPEYPGVYLTNEVTALPLATSGYDIYVIGENPHATKEIHLLFIEYLKILHETRGLRDVIMEVNQHAEEEANAYILGETEEFQKDLWNRPDRFDVLERIRVINQGLPDRKKIRVHLVDLDIGITPQGYDKHTHTFTHLTELKEEIGADNIDIPPLEEYVQWDEDALLELVENLEEKTEDEAILNELKTVRASIKIRDWRFSFDIREETIARNIQYVLRELDSAPVLALYGAYHVCKIKGKFSVGDPWVHRLIDSGKSVYSVMATGMSGQYWIDYWHFEIDDEEFWYDEILLDENTTIEAIFDKWSFYEILYVDLRINSDLRIPWQASGHFDASFETKISEVYDGIILFRKVSPSR